MKFTVEVEDFYLEEGDLAGSLKDFIQQNIANQIYKVIKDQVTSLIDSTFREQVSEQLAIRVDTLVKEVSSTHKIKKQYSNTEDLSIREYIDIIFRDTNIKSKTDSFIESQTRALANQFATEMKQRYDMLFASQLVQRMNEVGMLKQEVGQMLLKKEDESISKNKG